MNLPKESCRIPAEDAGNPGEREDDEMKIRQQSENFVVPDPKGNLGKTPVIRQRGGGKGVPVREEGQQLMLFSATAENLRTTRSTEGGKAGDLSPVQPQKVPKAETMRTEAVPAGMEDVVERLETAFQKVAANKGAPGPDRQTVEQVRLYLPNLLKALRLSLLDGSYIPGDIRRVWIPKSGGGARGLGIPNVVDRVVQEAIRSVLEPLYEPTFHPSSHGFRPGRGCQTAIAEARSYVEEGCPWVVDLDLEKFFDRVPHQRLMARLAQRVQDRRLLALISRMLKAKVVLPDGVKVSTEEGVPQGGPLSPLLSNIVLSELDEELARRKHRFVRYADDCNIYVRSERAGKRVMASVVSFIEGRMCLKVNVAKSAVARPETRHFLGYRLKPETDKRPEILLSERSVKRLNERIRELTPRNRGWTLKGVIGEINGYLSGWFGHFRVCTPGISYVIHKVDAHIRRRLRALILKQWKSKLTIARRLIQRGGKPKTVWRRVYEGRKSIWNLSHDPVVDRALSNASFAALGLETLKGKFEALWEPMPAPPKKGEQLSLFGGYLRS